MMRPVQAVLLSVLILTCVIPHGASAQSGVASLGPPELEIGVLSGDDAYVFGQITDVAATPSGEILVVDAQFHRLRAFNSEGEPLAEVGRAGQGPGEFIYPAALAVVDDEVLVLDAGTMRVERFGLSSGRLEHRGSIGLPFPARDFCVVNDRLMLLGSHEGAVVHSVTFDGEHEHSFGAPFHEDPVIAALTGRGYIACADGPEPWVAVSAWNFAEVSAYGLDGTPRWSVQAPDFDGGEITRTEGGNAVRFGPKADGGAPDMMVSLVELGGSIVVQWGVMKRDMGALEDIVEVTTAVLDPTDGRLVDRADTVPRVDAAFGRRVFSRANDPFPRVRVREWR